MAHSQSDIFQKSLPKSVQDIDLDPPKIYLNCYNYAKKKCEGNEIYISYVYKELLNIKGNIAMSIENSPIFLDM